MTTRIETIPGDYAPAGALNVADLPFNRDNLKNWMSARNVTTATGDGETLLTGFQDLRTGQVYGSSSPGNPPLRLLMDDSGLPYGESRFGASGAGGGYETQNPFSEAVDSQTLFAIARAGNANSSAYSVFTGFVNSNQGILELSEYNTSAAVAKYRVVGRRRASSSADLFYIDAPLDAWFGAIIEFNYVAQSITAEVVDFSSQSVSAFTAETGQSGVEESGRGQLALSTGGILRGGVMEVGRFAGVPESAENKERLRSYLRRTVGALNAT